MSPHLYDFLGRLFLHEAEVRTGQVLGLKGRTLVFLYPEVAVDVDQPSGPLMAETVLGARPAKGLWEGNQ